MGLHSNGGASLKAEEKSEIADKDKMLVHQYSVPVRDLYIEWQLIIVTRYNKRIKE
jgi:hypothetical protein